MSERQVYLFGYSGRRPAELLDAAVRLDAVVFDVRYSPRSRHPEWRRKPLAALLGDRYRFVGAFGNRLYQSSDIELADPERGLALFDQETRPVILLCMCRESATCHRTTVAAYIAERRDVRVSDLDDALAEHDERQLSLFGGESG